MGEPPDYHDLAKRYVALWQEQLIAAAGDPQLAESLARLFTIAGAMAPWGEAVWKSAKRRQDDAAEPRAAKPDDAAARTPAAAAPPDERGDALDRLTRRIAALEERLAVVETGARGGRERARLAPRRRRS
jgi:hypothetical protein